METGEDWRATAGQPSPYLCHADGSVEPITEGASGAVGMLDGAQFAATQLFLENGDSLVLYTPARGADTGTNQYRAEATVVDGKVTAFGNRATSGAPAARTPSNGFVLSGHGPARDWLVAIATVAPPPRTPGVAPFPPG